MDSFLPEGFNPDDYEWDEYPPGRDLPDHLPPPLKLMLRTLQQRGGTVKIVWGEDGTTVRHAIAEGQLSDMDELDGGYSDEPVTEDHEPHCDCKLCAGNRLLQKVNESQELETDDKLEAAIKLAAKLSEETQAAGDLPMTANLLVNGLAFAAQRKNRQWLVESVQARLTTQATAMLTVPKGPAPEGETPAEKVTRIGDQIMNTLAVQDTGSLLGVLTRGRPRFRFRDFKDLLAHHGVGM